MRFPISALRIAAPFLALCLGVLPAHGQNNSVVMKDAPTASAPATIQQVRNGIQLTTGKLNVKVQFYAEGIVRVTKWPAGGTSNKLSLSVIQKVIPNLGIHFKEDTAEVILGSPQLTLMVSKSDGSIQYLDSDRRVVLKEQGRPVFTPTRIAREKSAFSVQQNFTLSADEGVYGLGQHSWES